MAVRGWLTSAVKQSHVVCHPKANCSGHLFADTDAASVVHARCVDVRRITIGFDVYACKVIGAKMQDATITAVAAAAWPNQPLCQKGACLVVLSSMAIPQTA
jgi:hypothetical protein